MTRVIELVSPLPPRECAARLREATDRDGWLAWVAAGGRSGVR